MREKRLVFALLATILIVFFAATSVRASPEIDHVKMYVWNSYDNTTGIPNPAGSNTFPWKPYGTTLAAQTTVYVAIDSPDSWADTANGIVAYTVSLQVNPAQAEVMGAFAIADAMGFGYSNGLLGWYLYNYGYTNGILAVPATVDKVAGTITGFGEAIAGYTDLGKGAGGGPWILMFFRIRTPSGVTGPGSLLTLFAAQYTTPDGVIHDVTDLEVGVYGAPVVPEFPAGLTLLLAVAPMIAIVYLWRTKSKKKVV